MTECVIIFRNTGNGKVGFVTDEDEPAVFKDYEEAIAAVSTVAILRAFPYQIVELDELP